MTHRPATRYRPYAVFRKAYREAPWRLLGVAIDDAFRPVRPGHKTPSSWLLEARLIRSERMPPVIARSEAAALRIALRAAIDTWPEQWDGPPELPTYSIEIDLKLVLADDDRAGA